MRKLIVILSILLVISFIGNAILIVDVQESNSKYESLKRASKYNVEQIRKSRKLIDYLEEKLIISIKSAAYNNQTTIRYIINDAIDSINDYNSTEIYFDNPE